jgi:hypothetical protein
LPNHTQKTGEAALKSALEKQSERQTEDQTESQADIPAHIINPLTKKKTIAIISAAIILLAGVTFFVFYLLTNSRETARAAEPLPTEAQRDLTSAANDLSLTEAQQDLTSAAIDSSSTETQQASSSETIEPSSTEAQQPQQNTTDLIRLAVAEGEPAEFLLDGIPAPESGITARWTVAVEAIPPDVELDLEIEIGNDSVIGDAVIIPEGNGIYSVDFAVLSEGVSTLTVKTTDGEHSVLFTIHTAYE